MTNNIENSTQKPELNEKKVYHCSTIRHFDELIESAKRIGRIDYALQINYIKQKYINLMNSEAAKEKTL